VFAFEIKSPRDIELIVVGSVRAFEMGIFFTVAFVVLDEAAAEGSDQASEFDDFEPAFASELLAVVDGEDNLGADAMGPQPGDGPEVKTEAIGPGAFSGISNQFEPGGDVQRTPLEVGDLITIQMEDLLAGQGLKIPNMFQIHLDDFEGFGRVPVDELSFFEGAAGGLSFAEKAVFIASEDIADGGPRDGELLVLGQIDGQALSAEASFILGLDDPIFDASRSPARLTVRDFGSVPQIPFLGFAQDVINDGPINAEKPSRLGDVMSVGFQELKDGLSGGFGIDLAQFLVGDLNMRSLDTGSRLHRLSSFRFPGETHAPIILTPASRTPYRQNPNCV